MKRWQQIRRDSRRREDDGDDGGGGGAEELRDGLHAHHNRSESIRMGNVGGGTVHQQQPPSSLGFDLAGRSESGQAGSEAVRAAGGRDGGGSSGSSSGMNPLNSRLLYPSMASSSFADRSIASTTGDISLADSQAPLVTKGRHNDEEGGNADETADMSSSSYYNHHQQHQSSSTLASTSSDNGGGHRLPSSSLHPPPRAGRGTMAGAVLDSSSSGVTTPLPTPSDDEVALEVLDSNIDSVKAPSVIAEGMGNLDNDSSKRQRGLSLPFHRKQRIGNNNSSRAMMTKPLSKKRRFFRDPISTITSTMVPGRPKRSASGMNEDDVASAASSAAPNAMISVQEVVSKQSENLNSSKVEQLGYGDGKGTEGVLRRVYDTWALTSLGLANIGPIAGE